MPARSTPFQKLVLHIQQQLAGGASVSESEMLRHRLNGTEREVDVVVRAVGGEHPVVIALECIEQARPADQPWVEKMKAKHEFLETNKLVLVSLNGFYKPALELAKSLGIATYTPDQAHAADWTKIVGSAQLFVSRYDFTAEETLLILDAVDGQLRVPAGGDTRVRRTDIDAENSLAEFVSFVLNDRNVAEPALPNFAKDGRWKMAFDVALDKPLQALSRQGLWVPLAGIHLKVAVERTTSPFPIRSISWNGVPAAFGHAPTVLGDTVVTVVEKAVGEADAKLLVDGRELVVYRSPRGVEG